MKITIVLPAYYNFPIGGYNVHFAYANILSGKGHEVSIVFPRYLGLKRTWKTPVSSLLWALRTRMGNRPLISSVTLDKRIRIRLVADLQDGSLPKADILIATAWQTAEAVCCARADRGRKFYVVYDYEHWMTATPDIRRRIENTFSSNFSIIATSSVVAEMVEKCGGLSTELISCGLDFESFGVDISPEARNRFTLGFPSRKETFKGLDDAVKAALLLRQRYGTKLTVMTFGSHKPDLPDWIRWLEFPSQLALRQFYNGQAVFMLPSHFEGWGLTGVEAVACGAALVVTDNGGARDYAVHEKTALVVAPKQPELLAEAVSRLMENDFLRIKLAHAGNRYVQQFTWDSAGDKLNALLTGEVDCRSSGPRN